MLSLIMFSTLFAARTSAATKPAPADPFIVAAVAAAEGGTLPAFAATVDNAASEALSDPATADLSRIVQLATLREFGRWFGRVNAPAADRKAALAWLIRQKRLAPALMLSATTSDPPDRVLAVLTALRNDQRDKLERFPELTAAVCLVWDDPDRFGGDERPMDLPRIVRVFRHYADNPGLTRSAAEELPVELLVFVVDNLLSEAEVDWARRQYAQPPNVGNAFFEVGYGATRPLTRDVKPDTDPANVYSLANLRKFGGSLADQAYYAAQIGKTFGIPTTTCAALAGEGREAQAWVAFADRRGGRTRWDTTSGRYRMHLASSGTAIDPQTMEDVSLAELSLLAGTTQTPASKRAAAVALCKLLDRVPAEEQLAALKRAVELSPSDRRVWNRVAEWSQQHRPGSDEFREAASLISKHLAGRSDEAALHARLRMLAKLPADDRSAALAELGVTFDRRVDLVAIIQIARARALIERKDPDGALQAIGELIGNVDAIPARAVEAMQLVDDVLREKSELDRLADVYAQVWKGMRPPPQSPCAHTTPYFIIGQEYAQLLEEMGRKQEMTSIRERLAELYAEPVKR
ncbi:MAG: hypothetical protein WBD40_24460 [Tepidisphaeraceae bacterium]